MPGTIAVIGSLNVDFITTTPRIAAAGETMTATSFDTGLGGKGANQAIACARLSSASSNITTKMVGNVGDDAFGREYKEALEKDGIDHSHVRVRTGHKTGIANIIVETGSGENRIMLATNANHADGDNLTDMVPDDATVAVFQLEIPFSQVLHNCKMAHEKGTYVIVNPAPAIKLPDDVYKCIDCIILNETEAEIMCAGQSEEWSTFFFAKGVRDLVVRTLGSKGVEFVSRGDPSKVRTVAARKVKVVDTTAAGDTFVGAFAVKVAENGGKTPDHVTPIIEFANRAAAKTVERAGAVSAIPRVEELDA